MRIRSYHSALLAGASVLVSGLALAAETGTAAAPSERVAAAGMESPAPDVTSSIHAETLKAGTSKAEVSQSAAAPAKPVEALAIDRADWAPEHASKQAPAPKQAPASKIALAPASDNAAAQKPAHADENSGPDDEVTTPTAVPSHDPLDKPKTAAPASGPIAKPGVDKAANQAEEPLPPLNAAIKAALDKRRAVKGAGAAEKKKERDAIVFFYAAHGFAPAWSENGKAVAAVEPIVERLAHANEDALDLPAPPKSLSADGKAEDVAESDIALTEAIVSYARQATGSRIDPHTISPLIGARPDLADPAEVLDSLVHAGAEAGDKLRALNPSEPRYIALRKKLAELRADRQAPVATPIPAGPTLRIGMHDDRVSLLRARFSLEAPLDSDADDVYDKVLAGAVADFQRANGLSASGNLTKATAAALSNEKPSRNEGSIIANMEMWRWMPRDLGKDRIEVNVPDYMVTVFHDGERASQNRVVVGKTDTPTPLFSNTMKFLIVNPVWNVPQSIIENEMYGEARAGFTARYVHGRLYLQQPPGPKNALGRIKFMFPNPFSVYLHDTPAKHLFSTARRAYSHGCVRVDKPFEFAETVLNSNVPEGGKMVWSQQRLDKMLGNTEKYVDLPKPLPIHIEYFTANVDESGRLVTKEDIYGYTGAVAAALGHGGEVPKVALPKVAEKAPDRPRRRTAERRRARDAYEEGYGYAQVEPAPAPAGGGLFGIFPF